MPDDKLDSVRAANAAAIRAAKEEREEITERIYDRARRLKLDIGHFGPLEPPKFTPFDQRSSGVVVISLEGLRRIDAITSELEQRREAAGETVQEPIEEDQP